MPRRRFFPSALCLLIAIAFFLYRYEFIAENSQARIDARQFDTSFSPPLKAVNDENTLLTVAPNELPGYTGWARPELTDAGRFRIVTEPSSTAIAGQEWEITVECSSCTSDSWFYLRAYGPAIITGTVNSESPGRYRLRFLPIDPGIYTVEVVLTFSAVPSLTDFPLQDTTKVPNYEGYLLPGFPIFLTVQGNTPPRETQLPYCTIDQLTTTNHHLSPTTRARWKLIDSIRSSTHTKTVPGVDTIQLGAYQQSFQGLGLRFSYERTDCRIVGVPDAKFHPIEDCIASLFKPLHIILIGDSVMRLQRSVLEGWMKQMIDSGQAKITFYELYGGTLRSERLSGPKISTIPQEHASSNEQKIVLFNSGLHDIHRLCGDEWKDDRSTYLNDSELQQSCVYMYQIALDILFTSVLQIPQVDLFVFQTTTAGWPKYGNYGVSWSPIDGQGLPLDAGFVERFNHIAIAYISKMKQGGAYSTFHVMDGYWVSLPRPDNREISKKADIGKKLSHPGHEVTYAMVRFFSMMVLQTICPAVLPA
ncbi:hypothetical protein FisN_21Lh031 [Fistulifera solaris]|uniref:Uncharacterized protein n=1 Tax=Fistulifera solaris TaxID=1519565 RepID=A0A1Z5KJT6_FISSO|nr:hypothetical protein FisN_21Lh031 [Fistulifera solaris]|eukprot:GAX26563.1 hypothetical protein FisN_21Lh031 [Fistulifera solaris]